MTQYGCDFCNNPPPGVGRFAPGVLCEVDERGNQVSWDCPHCLGKERRKNFYGKWVRFGAHKKQPDLISEDLEAGTFKSAYHTENLFLRGGEADVGNAILWALSNMWVRGGEYGQWKYKVATDSTLKSLKFGEIADPSSKRERPISLEEFVTPPHLLIIELGVLEGRNAGASAAVLEALNVRKGLGKPTWIVEGNRKFQPGHTCFSHGMEQMLESFRLIEVGSQQPVAYNQPAPAKSSGDYQPKSKSKKKWVDGDVSEDDLDLDDILKGALG